jgi:hypothetical protein
MKFVCSQLVVQNAPNTLDIINYQLISIAEITKGVDDTVIVDYTDIWTSLPNNPTEFLYSGKFFGPLSNLTGCGGYYGYASLKDNNDGTMDFLYQSASIPGIAKDQAFYQKGTFTPFVSGETIIETISP